MRLGSSGKLGMVTSSRGKHVILGSITLSVEVGHSMGASRHEQEKWGEGH